MEWALLEAGEGNVNEARTIFARGAQGSPHAPLLAAWAELEQANGRSVKRQSDGVSAIITQILQRTQGHHGPLAVPVLSSNPKFVPDAHKFIIGKLPSSCV